MITILIKVEIFEINGVIFNRTYSDAGRYVVRDGISYEEACDPVEFERTYTEGDVIVHDYDINPTFESVAQELLETGLVTIPIEDDPDYFNESEQEPDYFG